MASKLYGVAIKDVFDRWILPNGANGNRSNARSYAHFLLVKGWSNTYGEITAVQVIPWGPRETMRLALAG